MPRSQENLRTFIDAVAASSRPRLLFVSHASGGGVERHVSDLVELVRPSVDVLAIRGFLNGGVELEFYSRDGNDVQITCGGFSLETLDLWHAALSGIGFSRVHVHHLHGWPHCILDVVKRLAVPIDVTLHDYFFVCPQYHLANEDDRYCGEPELSGCRVCVERRPHSWGLQIDAWRDEMGQFLSAVDRVFAPTVDVSRRLGNYFPNVNCLVVLHPDRTPIRVPRVTKVVLLGGLSRIKGLNVVRAVTLHAQTHAPDLAFRLIGHASDALPLGMTATGTYAEGDLPRLLALERPDVIWFPGQVPETYSYTLTTALAANVPIVASDLGAIAERLRDYDRATLLPHDAAADEWIAALSRADAGPTPAELQSAPSSYAEMYLGDEEALANVGAEVKQLSSVLESAQPAPTHPSHSVESLFRIGRYGGHTNSLDAIEMQIACLPKHERHIVGRTTYDELETYRLRLEAHRDALQAGANSDAATIAQQGAAIAAKSLEIEALAVKHAADVATFENSLAQAIGERNSARAELEAMKASRSWRWTQPLRSLASRLRR